MNTLNSNTSGTHQTSQISSFFGPTSLSFKTPSNANDPSLALMLVPGF
jgi:hypothetical protein